MSNARTELIELIEQIDVINMDNAVVVMELIQWLDTDTIKRIIEDVRANLDLDYVEEEDEEDECDFFSSRIPAC